MRPLTTAHVSTARGMRGGERQARLLLRGLRERGHECVLYASSAGVFGRRMRQEGFETVELPFRSEIDLVSVWRLARALGRSRPDVVQFHDGHAVTLGGLAARLAGLRATVATRRVDYSIRSAWKWRRLAARVIAVSRFARDVAVAGGISPARAHVVYSSVETARFEGRDGARARAALGLAESARIVSCSAALVPQKSHADLLAALPRVMGGHPDVTVLLVGTGELETPLREQARALGLSSDRLRFLGWREDVPDILAASDLFVMPSRYEGLCTAVLEAMWCGVPVVTTDAGGLPEAVGDCGRVVPAGRPDDLAAALAGALADPRGMGFLARRARARVEELFTPDVMVEGTLAVYAEIVGA